MAFLRTTSIFLVHCRTQNQHLLGDLYILLSDLHFAEFRVISLSVRITPTSSDGHWPARLMVLLLSEFLPGETSSGWFLLLRVRLWSARTFRQRSLCNCHIVFIKLLYHTSRYCLYLLWSSAASPLAMHKPEHSILKITQIPGFT